MAPVISMLTPANANHHKKPDIEDLHNETLLQIVHFPQSGSPIHQIFFGLTNHRMHDLVLIANGHRRLTDVKPTQLTMQKSLMARLSKWMPADHKLCQIGQEKFVRFSRSLQETTWCCSKCLDRSREWLKQGGYKGSIGSDGRMASKGQLHLGQRTASEVKQKSTAGERQIMNI